MREVLHEEDGLVIALVVDEESAIVEIASEPSGPDLSVPDEVVVVVDGEPVELHVEDSNRVYAVLGEAERLENPMSLLVRVFEFFEGWEFQGAEEA